MSIWKLKENFPTLFHQLGTLVWCEQKIFIIKYLLRAHTMPGTMPGIVGHANMSKKQFQPLQNLCFSHVWAYQPN